MSFVTVVFGYQHRQQHIIEQGYATHVTALRSLNGALVRHDCAEYDELILAIVALALQEAVMPTSKQSYLHHMIGLDNLLKLRDPAAHTSPWSLNIYKSIRHFLVFGCLRAGKSSVLALPEWKKVLKIGCDEEELYEQELWDLLADCTVLQARLHGLSRRSELRDPAGVSDKIDLERDTMQLLLSLFAWRSRWDSEPSNSNILELLVVMESGT